jgi:hypothetical protein
MTVLFLITLGLVLYVIYLYFLSEGFQAGMPGVRCGVDLPTCQNGLQCINGFCGAARQSNLPPNELPVYP